VQTADHVPLTSATSWTFTTATAPPAVTATTPLNGATGVDPAVAPTATFTTAMKASTFTDLSFSLTPLGGSPSAGIVALDPTPTTATFTPAVPLFFATQYTARLDTTIQAADGTPLAAAVSWTFTTSPAAPTVTGTAPANGATGVSLLAAPTATFSKS